MKFLVVLLIALTASFSFAQPGAEQVTYDITSLAWKSQNGGIPLRGGKTLLLPDQWRKASRIIFEDLKPGANWAHPAQYKLISDSGQILEVIPHTLPPRHLDLVQPVLKQTAALSSIRFNVDDFGGARRAKNPGRFWALLINGDADQRHWNDFSFLYRTLTKVYGYLPSHIAVADSVFLSRNSDLDDDGTVDIRYPSTILGVEEAVKNLAIEMKEGDRLVLVVNDHGGRTDTESTVYLNDYEMTASEFVKILDKLSKAQIIAIYAQCYSGGFVRPTLSPSRIALSASLDLELSWASPDTYFDEFLYHLTSAFAMQTHDGTRINSDFNNDNLISIKEAFAYAVAHDRTAESPLLEADYNSGNSDRMGLNF